jgi:nucleoside-diphosphate-sugar epimerase
VRVLVTGADGFVGRFLLQALVEAGHVPVGTTRSGGAVPAWAANMPSVEWTTLELTDASSVAQAAALPSDAVVHLAALASGREARQDPGLAWTVNAAGTARLVEALAETRREHGRDPRVLVVSTGEVYGEGPSVPRREPDPLRPVSPYAASKVGAEVAAMEVFRRTGLRVIVARPFAHTGPGQTSIYAAPAFVERLRSARRVGAPVVKVGNLAPVRDFLDVRDVVRAYVALLERGSVGETYNIASGRGVALRELFDELAALVGVRAVPEADPALLRAADLPHLVGDATKLHAATGWSPAIPFTQTLRDLVDAQAD